MLDDAVPQVEVHSLTASHHAVLDFQFAWLCSRRRGSAGTLSPAPVCLISSVVLARPRWKFSTVIESVGQGCHGCTCSRGQVPLERDRAACLRAELSTISCRWCRVVDRTVKEAGEVPAVERRGTFPSATTGWRRRRPVTVTFPPTTFGNRRAVGRYRSLRAVAPAGIETIVSPPSSSISTSPLTGY